MRFVASVLALAMAFAIVGKLSADEKACPTTKPRHHATAAWDMLKGLNLTDEQKATVKELKKEYRPRFKAAIDSVLTADQTKARDDAMKTAKAEGKKGHELWQAVRQAVKLTDEQKAKLKEAIKPLHKDVHEKLLAILTTEQKEQLKQKCEKYSVAKSHHAVGMSWRVLKGLNPTDDQKAKVKELRKEYRPKFKAAADSVLTTDQKQAREDAIKAAKAEGKKGRDVWQAVRQAVKLTDEQKAKLKEAVKPLHKELHEKIVALLTPEQQAQLKQRCEKRKDCK